MGMTIAEKIIAAASYLTAGLVGFLWIILSQVTGSRLKNFLRFHKFFLVSFVSFILLTFWFYISNQRNAHFALLV